MACILFIHYDPLQLDVLTMLLRLDYDEVVSCGHINDSLKVLGIQDHIAGIVLELHTSNVDRDPLSQRVSVPMSCFHRQIPILAVSSHYAETEAKSMCAEFQVDTVL